MTAARIWTIYRDALAENRRVQWATVVAALLLVAMVVFAAWMLVFVALYVVLALAILRTGLLDPLLPPNPDYDEF